jgi:hypothetical protein
MRNKTINAWLVECEDGLPFIFQTKEQAELFNGVNDNKIYPCKITYNLIK